MFGIIKKDARHLLIFHIPLLLITSVIWLTIKNELDATFVFVMGAFIFVMIIGVVFTNEANEEKNKGYGFLYPLPISTIDIVRAKFALILILDVTLIVYTLILFSFFKAPEILFDLSLIYMITIGSSALIVAACLYLGIYRFGFATFIRALTIFSMFLTAIPVVIKEFSKSGGTFDPTATYKLIISVNWYLVAMAALVIYYLLMLFAAKIKARHWVANM